MGCIVPITAFVRGGIPILFGGSHVPCGEVHGSVAGFGAAHGRTDISEERRAGKTKAKSYVVRKPLTVELVQSHLDGGDGVGAIPINEDNKCKFGALDIDVYPLDHAALIKQLSQNNVPCIVCRSKSGGAHVFFFL